jgi:hypothetical protein
MADLGVVRWQNKSIAASSDFRGVLAMGLLVAWFWFVWQFLSLPALSGVVAGLPPLLRFALDKGRYMPDFGLIIAGFAAFHFQRGLRIEWDRKVAIRLYLRLLAPLAAYFILSLVLFEVVAVLAGHHAALPWADALYAPAFRIMATVVVTLVLLPPLLYLTWTSIPDVCLSGMAICVAFYGISFQMHFHHHPALWPLIALFDFCFGLCVCASLFRGVEYVAAVRGPAIVLGWLALFAGAILAGPGLFFLGFTMIVGGIAVGERSWYLVGEKGLRAWSRTALALALVQPAVLAAWSAWGPVWSGSILVTMLLLAIVTQLLACLLYLVVIPPARRLLSAALA